MPSESAKRQITLHVADCEEVVIQRGDEVEIFRHGNQFNIIKKEIGLAAGLLNGTKVSKTVSDEQSRQDHFE